MTAITTATTRAALLASLIALGACGGGGGDAAPEPSPPPPPAAPSPQVTLAVTNGAGVSGNVVITLAPTSAPVTVANFLQYVNSGFYNGTVFHRLLPGFVIQGGGFAGPMTVSPTALGTPKPTNPPIVLEDNAGLPNALWTVAMARTGAPDSATSQFFINLGNNTNLNRTSTSRGYAVFGTITAGTDVITAAVAAPCTTWGNVAFGDGSCLPSTNLVITSATQTR
jgi:peptidyl-prolyl cis-trans isomerase A (cyclophilin A)